jgi:hypothetical protein
MRERAAALRAAWSATEASFDGTWDRFSASWVYPKPVNGTIPLALGNAGPLGIEHAATYGDEWCPIDASMLHDGRKPDVAGAIDLFRQTAADAGRVPDDIPISIVAASPRPGRIERYAELGVDQVVFLPPTMALHQADDALRFLDTIAPTMQSLA